MLKQGLLFLFFGVSLFAQAQQQTDEEQVQQLIQGSFDVLFSGFEADRVGEFYTEDFILLEDGEVWDMPKILDYFAKARQNTNPTTRVNRFEFIKTSISGNRAWIAYHNFATISRGTEVVREVEWLESATAVKTAEGWRLDMLHSTRLESK